MNLGGAITWLSLSNSEENIVNSWDWGRQIQMSNYGGPVPFTPNGKQPFPFWRGLGWAESGSSKEDEKHPGGSE